MAAEPQTSGGRREFSLFSARGVAGHGPCLPRLPRKQLGPGMWGWLGTLGALAPWTISGNLPTAFCLGGWAGTEGRGTPKIGKN